ncbi:MAG: uncharacterized protein KVP18_001899 [Porospora cf. gigantea A]|uniref:uncharacterized protein n=1 Tax=Porospora cf. gigantea A TaxID=2853593 RepID=UPI0035594828|nr:MAG: hypothetical protein KVP18_001899 [Porospora cf. gigantea A]
MAKLAAPLALLFPLVLGEPYDVDSRIVFVKINSVSDSSTRKQLPDGPLQFPESEPHVKHSDLESPEEEGQPENEMGEAVGCEENVSQQNRVKNAVKDASRKLEVSAPPYGWWELLGLYTPGFTQRIQRLSP